MAQNIVSGLFGITPNDVYDAYAAQDRRAAVDLMNNPTLAQMGIYYGSQIGSGLGRGVASLLGAEDPRLQQAKIMAEAQQQNFDTTSPEGLQQLAQFFVQRGQPGLASQVAQQAQEIKKLYAEEQLKKAQAVKALQEPQGTEAERNRNFLIQVEQKLARGEDVPQEAKNQAALILQEMSKPKSFFDPSSGQMITQPGLNPLQSLPNLSNNLLGNKQTTPQSGQISNQQGVSTSLPGGIQTTQVTQPKMDAGTIKELGALDADIIKIDDSLKNIRSVKNTINSLDLGLLQNTGRSIQSILGVNTKDRLAFDKAQRTVQQQANNLLLLAKGVQTEGDAKRAYETIMNPDTWKNTDALQAAFNDLETITSATKEALAVKRNTLQSGGRTEAPKASNKPKASRSEAFAKLKAANPNKSDAAINNWLDKQGY